MKKYEVCSGIPAGGRVANGCGNSTCTAPNHGGPWVLIEMADDNNCHVSWGWKEGECDNALYTYEQLRED